ncbi:DUF1707 domain-containing protein [Actinoplanes sp. DH11]|uniref:DUF1707 SHOCT-like domain-containing protein n=1 Tax=Actinoplanes sp. DH11 TaxID=2857011 RepID=UPI001E58E3F6|nr:DUF1707 domain-containing protein [Actinoplanes sp. DH11]
MNDPTLRASDAERQRVVVLLEEHTAAGRLTLDEYAERVDRVLACRTHGDLARVTADLPVQQNRPADDNRHLLWAFLVAGIVLALFTVVLTLAR